MSAQAATRRVWVSVAATFEVEVRATNADGQPWDGEALADRLGKEASDALSIGMPWDEPEPGDACVSVRTDPCETMAVQVLASASTWEGNVAIRAMIGTRDDDKLAAPGPRFGEETPTTACIRATYAAPARHLTSIAEKLASQERAGARFDRWLAAHDAALEARVRADVARATAGEGE